MTRATAKFIRALFGLAVLAACPVLTFAQQPQAMCRETLEAWVRDKSLNAKWNGDHTAVIMVRGGVEYICTCPSQTRPPVCKPAGPASASKAEAKSSPPPPPPASAVARPIGSTPPSSFAREKEELLLELQASGFIEPDFEKSKAELLASLDEGAPAGRAEVTAAIGELAVMSPATLEKVGQDIARREEPPNPDVTAVVRSFKVKAPPPLAKRFDRIKVGDVLLLRQPDDMLSLDFYTSGWIIIVDKATSATLRPRASHTFMCVREVEGVKLFLDNMPGQGTRIKTGDQVLAEYGSLGMDVAQPLSAFDADKLWAASRELGIRSLKEFAKRADNRVDTTDYGPYGDDDMVCSETCRWALMKAGLVIPETRSVLKKYAGGVDFGPANFYTDTKNFLVTPLESLRVQDPQ
ncbi:MAG: hypothetical protein H6P95_2053 [Candidatus Aminicenantes bacterium]|nr:hypothetical protein [Candidatus Aminicenantes bacterium]